MKRFPKILVLSFFLFSIAFSCTKDSKDTSDVEEARSLNPNGDSELAILMRQMYKEAESIKSQLKNDEAVTIELNYDKILSANATEPEKAESDEYKSFAQVHIQNMEMLKDSDPSKRLQLYESMVNNCLNCHKELCPGPMARIKKLKLPKSEFSAN